ncbi:MAG: TldD/PmbA family protein [Candidatus Eisenbacteria bacterium]|uniref:TldD/PmbA family protein n=1 Tax=Eiseniibacteriota bacterium TaxID=2212470 RepID=A0A948RY16_UNCEI|nr:TldD/PmbA family protein [Candidatus Eisenbacteria bacterium]MBU1948940.1 TldD/PmbA family protein [Candidatus Eisenbacteria bacterium]MBU2693125.1 TldD/PmbA family protein [Candidatus Eisenbacteria bacterium]
MFEELKEKFRQVMPGSGFCSLRAVRESNEIVQVRQSVLQPITRYEDQGVMITVVAGGGYGYAATSDLSVNGLRAAVERAQSWAALSAGKSVVDYGKIAYPHPTGEYASPVKSPWESVPLKDKIDMVSKECARLKIDDRIADSAASLWYIKTDILYLTNGGGEVRQALERLLPTLRVTASEGAESQTRNLGAGSYALQGGMEIIDKVGFLTEGPRLAQEAIALLSAPNCPSGTMDLLLAPDQMHLQIHESIGHPLEIDRILGDERNYAGTTFVKPEYVGSFRYGSDLLNITYDPTIPDQWASFGFDDDGLKAEKLFIIEKGILKRALGGLVSQTRSGLPGVATTRADGWRRPPIDRMSNLNLEPGTSTFDEMVASVEKGIYMQTNTSWSIDDSRNKFQFGCEWGRLIENGKLTDLVRKPNYRGISGTFWNNLKMVGDQSTFRVLGVPNCGKGEPNQIMKVGHASPAALFADVEVFGGE